MTIYINLRFEDHSEGYRLAATLTERYGDACVHVEVDLEADDTASDIDLIAQVRTIITTATSPQAAREALVALQRASNGSNDQMHWLDGFIANIEPDPAPPRGIPRPKAPPAPKVPPRQDPPPKGAPRSPFSRPLTQGGTGSNRQARVWCYDNVACPTCHRKPGSSCVSPKGHDYGNHTVHLSRLDQVIWSDE